MVYHKLIPIFENDKIRYGIYALAISVMRKTGYLQVHFENTHDHYEYSFESEKWKQRYVVPLTDQEKLIFRLSIQGLDNEAIANAIAKSPYTLNHALTPLFEKLGVENMKQAIVYAINHQMLYMTNEAHCIVEKGKKNLSKKPYNKYCQKLTAEALRHIQTSLDNNQKVGSIAKEIGFSEKAVREAIKKGKLIKKSTNDSD
jgi:DNA-binding CsgD family transcriptional regulator